MLINRIKLVNFRGFEKLDFNIEGKSVVLFGINGAGKSSILRAIDLVYANIIRKLTNSKKLLAEMDTDDINDSKPISQIEVYLSLNGKEYSYYRKIDRDGKKTHIAKKLNKITEVFREMYLSPQVPEDIENINDWKPQKKAMPIFVNYGVNRLVIDKSLVYTEKTYNQLSAFENAIENKLDFASFFSWFRKSEDIENQIIAASRKIGIDSVKNDTTLETVRNAMLSMFPDFDNVRCERQNNTLVLEKNGNLLNINQLSDGEKCTIALFGDIARRLAIANEGVLIDPLKGKGVVLIDEIDLHLHPDWQRKIVGTLRRTFPNIQFVITTHSPQVLGDIPSDMDVYALKSEQGKMIIDKRGSLYGWDSNIILEEEMGTHSLSENVKKKIMEMYDAYDNDKYDKAIELADEIDMMTNGHNEHVSGVRVMISRAKRQYEKDMER